MSKVLYICQHYSNAKGSAGVRPYIMSQKLVAKGHEVTLLCGSYGGSETGLLEQKFVKGCRIGNIEGVKIIEFEIPYSNKISFVLRMIQFFKFSFKATWYALTSKYDKIFCTSTPLTSAIPGILAKLFRQKEFILEIRDLWPELPVEMGVISNKLIIFMLSTLEKISYSCADKLIGLAPGICQEIDMKTNNKKIFLVPNGSDKKIFFSKENNFKLPNNIKDDDFLAVYAGTLGLANYLDPLISVGNILKQKNVKNIKILIIGDGREKKRLANQCKVLELDNVIFLDPVNKIRLGKIFRRANAGLQILADIKAFHYGTSPNKFFDYLAVGLPVIVNYEGWVADLINEYKCGISVSPNKPEYLAEALIRLSKDKNLDDMSQNSTYLSKLKFNWDQLSDDWVNIVIN